MKINVKTLTGMTIELEVEPNNTINYIKFRIESKEEILSDQQNLIFGREQLEDEKTLSDYGIIDQDTIQLVRGEILIYVKTLDGKTITLGVELEDSVENIQNDIEDIEGIPCNQQKLIFSGKFLKNKKQTLADCHITKESTLVVLCGVGSCSYIYFSQQQFFKKELKNFQDMSSVIRRTLYKSLVRQAKELDKTNIAGFILSSSALTSQMSSELQAVVQTDNVIALDLVRVMARKGCHVSVGFEASRWMGLINRSVSEPLVTFKRGDIIRHKLIDDIGVVLNVYPSCNMPKGWISRAFGSTDHPLINQPWYDVVLDKRNGGFTTHTTGLFNESVTCEIESPLLKAEGWKYDNSAGCYQPPQAIKR